MRSFFTHGRVARRFGASFLAMRDAHRCTPHLGTRLAMILLRALLRMFTIIGRPAFFAITLRGEQTVRASEMEVAWQASSITNYR